jgi:hypothetical protein
MTHEAIEKSVGLSGYEKKLRLKSQCPGGRCRQRTRLCVWGEQLCKQPTAVTGGACVGLCY